MITEDQLEQLCLNWFQEIGYDYVCGYTIAPDGESPERADYRQIILTGRLLAALQKINPHIPVATLEQVAQQIAKPDSLTLIKPFINSYWKASGLSLRWSTPSQLRAKPIRKLTTSS